MTEEEEEEAVERGLRECTLIVREAEGEEEEEEEEEGRGDVGCDV